MDYKIPTFTDRMVDPLNLSEGDIDIQDIAHALACVNRFSGHARYPVSVAQHSVYVSWMCDDDVALQALLHDASEAYLGDVNRWVKRHPAMALYRECEDLAQRTIYRRFGCPEEPHPQVEAADRLMVRMEAQYSFDPKFVGEWRGWKEMPVPLLKRQRRKADQQLGIHYRGRHYRRMYWAPWGWSNAERAFLNRYMEITEGVRRTA